MIISPNMLKTVTSSKEMFIQKYIYNNPEFTLNAPFKKGKEIHALANYYLSGQNIEKLENSLDLNQMKLWNTVKNSKYFKFQCIESEYQINAKIDKFWIGGRIDSVMKNDKNYYILDYKTGEIPDNAKYDYQTMVYLYCMDKLLKNYDSLNFVYIGLRDNEIEKITLNETLKKEYEKLILEGCLQIQKLL